MDDLKDFLNEQKKEGSELAKNAKGGALDTINGYLQCIDEVLEFIDENS